MQPLAVLVVLPVAIGMAAALALRDVVRASLVAAIASAFAVYVCLTRLDPGGQWNELASFLVSPLAIAFTLATVLGCFGIKEGRRRHPKRSA